jgi:hypothetical protein
MWACAGGKGRKEEDGPQKAILLAALVFVFSLYSPFLSFPSEISLLLWVLGVSGAWSNFGMCKPHLNREV